MKLMPIERIDDWEERLARQDAFWHNEVIGRPVASFSVPRPNPEHPWPAPRQYPSERDRWFDAERIVAEALAIASCQEFMGDSLPTYNPNLGPEVFSSFFGTQLEYGPATSWSIPNLTDWADADRLQFSRDNVYWRKLAEITDAMLDAGRGRFYVGQTDWHPGGDALAAFRDPLNLNIDLIEHPAEVKRLLGRVTETYKQVFGYWHGKLSAAGQAATCWLGVISTRKWYVPSNDFSCMISKKMFDEFFLPGIADECRFLEASIYHLDGPGALRHLDSLLEIKELNAIQWVYGAGQGRASDWMHLYKKCQAAGKGLQIGLGVDELDFFMENLRPEGLWLGIGGIRDRAHGDAVLRRLFDWT